MNQELEIGTSRKNRTRSMGGIAGFIFLSILLGICLGTVLRSIAQRYESFSFSREYSSGKPLSVRAAMVSVGVIKSGRRCRAGFDLTNAGTLPIKVIGAESTCSCATVTELPFTMMPGENRRLNVEVVTRDKIGQILEELRVFTDHPDLPSLVLRVTGEVTKAPDSGS
jgi:Protein of unknown function (DUF1573)